MRKLTVAIVAVLALAALPMLAATDNYHYNANMNCSDCHSMHASAHDNQNGGTAITAPNTTPGTAINPYYPAGNPANGNPKLLKSDDVCATCHDGKSWAPDVIGANSNAYQRSAGGTVDGAGIIGGHKIGSTVPAPGAKTDVINYSYTELECQTCHSPHGGTAFRNLVPYGMSGTAGFSSANAKPTVTKGAFTTATDATVLGGDTYTFGAGQLSDYYGRDKVVYAKSGAFTYNGATSNNRMDQFCGVCHGNFHGGAVTENQVGNGTDFTRHPTSTVSLQAAAHNAPNASFNTVKGFANVRVYQAAAAASDMDSPGCLSCHKAHGSANPFGLIYPSRTAADTKEAGDGVYKDLCKSCHSMGGS
jgi:hypothetical protein